LWTLRVWQACSETERSPLRGGVECSICEAREGASRAFEIFFQGTEEHAGLIDLLDLLELEAGCAEATRAQLLTASADHVGGRAQASEVAGVDRLAHTRDAVLCGLKEAVDDFAEETGFFFLELKEL
jgi:hypothetical protein